MPGTIIGSLHGLPHLIIDKNPRKDVVRFGYHKTENKNKTLELAFKSWSIWLKCLRSFSQGLFSVDNTVAMFSKAQVLPWIWFMGSVLTGNVSAIDAKVQCSWIENICRVSSDALWRRLCLCPLTGLNPSYLHFGHCGVKAV